MNDNLIKIEKAVIVEGKYDKIKLSNIVDALIIETDGFAIFKDKNKQKLIRRLAKEKGILVLTDSDSAGFTIRSFLSGIVSNETITHAYIPDILGKEKRKAKMSKEGKLGVEGVNKKVIINALNKAGVIFSETDINLQKKLVTKTDLFEDGLSGGKNSAQKRQMLLKQLDLPEHLSANNMLKLINTFMTYEDYK
ncbi:MAG: DUF4093 domain-containing protein, partial [Oscillospiraceae bacterium]